MAIDSMRVGGSRCPPLLVGVLLLACLLLICNWWTLSSENLELVRQIDELNEQIKISGDERDQCVTIRESLEQKYKHAEDEIASLHVRLQQEIEMKKKLDDLVESVSVCQNKLSSLNKADETKSETLKTLRTERDNITVTLEAARNENQKLQQEISKMKEECQVELNRVKLNCNAPDKKANNVQPSNEVFGKTYLVPESTVKISVSGQRGLKYHGIPILPKDPPGAVRLKPRYSITMLKGSDTNFPSSGKDRNIANHQRRD